MTIKVGDLLLWSRLPEGLVLRLKSDHPRQVRVALNTSQPTHVGVLLEQDSEERFLGVVDGLETIEFTTPGPCQIVCTTEGEVWFNTVDGDSEAIERAETSFTRIAERRVRNPQLEEMMWKMESNMRRRLDQAERDMRERLAAEARAHNANTETGEIEDEPVQSRPEANPAAPANAGSAANDDASKEVPAGGSADAPKRSGK